MKKTIDEIIADKIFSIVNMLISIKVKPDISKDNVTELTESEIDNLKRQYGIEGIILDVDNTLRINMKSIPLCNEEWLDMIRKKLKVIVVSNGKDRKMEDFFKLKDINYIGFAFKPLKKNFQKACNLMRLRPDQILIIGNDLFCDIYMGRRFGTKTLQVKRVKKDDNKGRFL